MTINLAKYSEQFDNAVWNSTTGATITADAGIAPSGSLSADQINYGTPPSNLVQVIPVIGGQQYAASVWVFGSGANIGKNIRLALVSQSATPTSAVLDIALTATPTQIQVTLVMPLDATRANFYLTSLNSGFASAALVWGAQLEIGSAFTVYMPTTTVAYGPLPVSSADQLTDPVWGGNNIAVTELFTNLSPNGANFRVTAKSTVGAVDPSKYLIQSNIPGYLANTQYTLTCYFQSESNWNTDLILWLRVGGVASMTARFDTATMLLLENPTVSNMDNSVDPWSSVTAGVKNMGSGWYAFWVSGISPSQVSLPFEIILWNNTTQNAGNSFLVGGFSLDQGIDSTYSPTGIDPPPFLLTFPFPFYLFQTQYPDNSDRVQLGKGYVFTSRPTSPPQRIFSLDLLGMTYQMDDSGNPDSTRTPLTNAYALDLFYRAVQLYGTFVFPHPIYGNLVVRFNRPLVLPKVIPGGTGVLSSCAIELIEVV